MTHLPSDEVHVWCALLTEARPEDLGLYPQLLDDEERRRAERLLNPLHRKRFIFSHGVLRCVLARYRDVEPSAIEFVRDANGKPRLRECGGPPSLHFNMSHSGDMVLVALARSEVGVDVEYRDANIHIDAIGKMVLTDAEREYLHDFDGDARIRVFYRFWTSKEAVAKAMGVGFGKDLRTLPVMAVDDEEEEISGFRVRRFEPGNGFTVAVACSSQAKQLHSGWWHG
jgi:4'-phosphopantetheinyl transferase